MRIPALLGLTLIACALGACAQPTPTLPPTATPTSPTPTLRSPEWCGAQVELPECQNITPTPPTASPTPAAVPTATPRRPAPTPTLTTEELTRQRRATAAAQPTPTATPTPTPQPRYQVFYDDIELARGTEAWEAAKPPEPRTCPEGHVPSYDSDEFCRDSSLTGPIIRHNSKSNIDHYWQRELDAAEVERRYQLLEHQPESEQEKYWPGICRDINERVYIPALYRVSQNDDPSFLNSSWHPIFLGGHTGELRMLLTTECAEHVPYEPYPEPPDLDCANYASQEEAEEARWTFWYAEDVGDLIDYVVAPTYTLEVVCGYLPSRPKEETQ